MSKEDLIHNALTKSEHLGCISIINLEKTKEFIHHAVDKIVLERTKDLEKALQKAVKDGCSCGWDDGGSGMFKGGDY